MFKPKNVKTEEIKEVIEAIVEVEDEFDEVKENPEEVPEEPKEDSDEEPTEGKINLTPGEVISIVEFNLHRAIESLQLLK